MRGGDKKESWRDVYTPEQFKDYVFDGLNGMILVLWRGSLKSGTVEFEWNGAQIKCEVTMKEKK